MDDLMGVLVIILATCLLSAAAIIGAWFILWLVVFVIVHFPLPLMVT